MKRKFVISKTEASLYLFKAFQLNSPFPLTIQKPRITQREASFAEMYRVDSKDENHQDVFAKFLLSIL